MAPALKKSKPNSRYLVPDLAPAERLSLQKVKPRFVFVAESPHIHEIEPETLTERRPLCGAAGKQWWSLLSELLEGKSNSDVSLSQLEAFTRKHAIAVMNAVQFPLDPKVAARFPDADPIKNLKFNKVAGEYSFKKLKKSPAVSEALQSLAARLNHPALANAPIYCLGNDSLWLVTQALGPEEAKKRVQDKIPHPSAWWRSGGHYGRVAKEKLQKIFETEK